MRYQIYERVEWLSESLPNLPLMWVTPFLTAAVFFVLAFLSRKNSEDKKSPMPWILAGIGLVILVIKVLRLAI